MIPLIPVCLSDTYRLGFSATAGVTASYKLHREWKAEPAASGNGCQTHDLALRVDFVGDHHVSATKTATIRLLSFSGRGTDTKHLKAIAPQVVRLRFRQSFSPSGFLGRLSWIGYNEAGWAGMMAAKTVGLYEVGFLNIAYPQTPVKAGDTWTAVIHVGDEGIDSNQTLSISGNNPLCTYRLIGVDSAGKTAKIGFDLKTTMAGKFRDFDGKAVSDGSTLVESGVWTVDLKTGLPLTFQATRKRVRSGQGRKETESTVTSVKRV